MDPLAVRSITPKPRVPLMPLARWLGPLALRGPSTRRTVLTGWLLLALLSPLSAAGTPAGFWDDDDGSYSPWRTAHDGAGHMYLANNLTGTPNQNVAAGVQVGRLVRVDEATGAVDPTFQWNEQLGSPRAVAVQPDGKVVVAVNNGPRDGNRVVRVNPDGSFDPTYGSPIFARPARFITLQPDGKLLMATDYLSISNAPGAIMTSGVAVHRLMPDGSVDNGFTVVVCDGFIMGPPALDSSGRIYVAGSFNTVNGSSHRAIVRCGTDGVLDLAFAAPAALPAGFISNSVGRMIRVQSDGRVVLIGRFGYTSRGSLFDPVVAVRFNADGSFDNTFAQPLRSVTLSGASTQDYPRAMAPADNDGFYVGSDRLQRFNADGSLDGTFPSIIYNESVLWISRSPTTGNLYVPNLSSVPGNIASYTAAGAVNPGFSTGGWGTTKPPLSAITLNDGRLLATGQFDHYNAQVMPGAVLFDTNAAPVATATPFLNPALTLQNPTVRALQWADGSFVIMQSDDGETITGINASAGIARYLADGTPDPAWNPTIPTPASWNYEPTADGGLIAWQPQPTYEQIVANGTAAYLKKYLANGAPDPSFTPNLNALVSVTRAVNSPPTQILAGRLLKVRAVPDGTVLLCLADTTGYVTIRRIQAGGQIDGTYGPLSLEAATSTSGYTNAILDPLSSQYFQAAVTAYSSDLVIDLLPLPDGRAYATGPLSLAGQPAGLARIRANGTLDPSFAGTGLAYNNVLNLPGVGTALAADSLGRVYLAGRFTAVNGTPANGLARFTAAGALDTAWTPDVQVRDNLVLGTVLVAGHGWLNILGNGALPADPLPTGFLRVALPDTVLPVITTQPLGRTVNAGASVTFTVTASGADSYQWYKDGVPVALATNASLTLAGVAAADAASYTVAVGNATGTVTSNAAILAVVSGYSLYVQTYFSADEQANPAVSGPNAVYGADGLTNLVKYALGLNPKVDTTAGLPAASTTATDWVYTYVRPTDRADLVYTVESSGDLTTWSTANVTHELISTSGENQTWQGRVPLAGNATLFFRLKVVQP